MYDHLTFLGLTFTLNQSVVARQSDIENPLAFIDLLLNGKGPLTSLGGVEALAYIKTNASQETAAYPDMELIYIGGGLQVDRGFIYRRIFRVSDEAYNTVWRPLEDKFACQVFPMLVHPKSFGEIFFLWPKILDNSDCLSPRFECKKKFSDDLGRFDQDGDLPTEIAQTFECYEQLHLPENKKKTEISVVTYKQLHKYF